MISMGASVSLGESVNFLQRLLANRRFCFILVPIINRAWPGGNRGLPVKTLKTQKLEAALCVCLSLVIVGVGLLGYALRHQLGPFAPQTISASGAVDAALLGVGDDLEPAWHYAFAPSYIREKAYYTPEAIAWPAEYYYYWDKDLDMDISGDVTQGEFPVLLQWDKRWGYRLYGTNFMGNNGCGPTALSILYTGLTGDTSWTPYDLAMYSIENDLYVPNVGTKWAIMEIAAGYLGLDVTVIGEDLELALPALEEGKALICKVGPGDFTSGGHFIVVTELLEDGQVEVRDPNSREKSAVAWDLERILEQTDYAWAYTVRPEPAAE